MGFKKDAVGEKGHKSHNEGSTRKEGRLTKDVNCLFNTKNTMNF